MDGSCQILFNLKQKGLFGKYKVEGLIWSNVKSEGNVSLSQEVKKRPNSCNCGHVKNPFWLFGHDHSHHLICTLFILCKVWMNLTKTILKDKQHPCCLCSINEKGTLFPFFSFFYFICRRRRGQKDTTKKRKDLYICMVKGKKKIL